MKLVQLLNSGLIHCSPETSVQEVASLMKDEGTGALIVVDEGKAVGMVTDRDLIMRVICEELNPETTQAKEIMTRRTVSLSVEQSLGEVVQRMKETGVRRIIVTDSNGSPLGLIGFEDVCANLAGDLTAIARPLSATGSRVAVERGQESAA